MYIYIMHQSYVVLKYTCTKTITNKLRFSKTGQHKERHMTPVSVCTHTLFVSLSVSLSLNTHTHPHTPLSVLDSGSSSIIQAIRGLGLFKVVSFLSLSLSF